MANGDWRHLSWKHHALPEGMVNVPNWAALSVLVVYRNVAGLGLYDDGPVDGDDPDGDDPN